MIERAPLQDLRSDVETLSREGDLVDMDVKTRFTAVRVTGVK